MFLDPSKAVFVILGEHEELEPHADLRQELLKRSIDAAIADPRPPRGYGRNTLETETTAPRTGHMGNAVPALTRRGYVTEHILSPVQSKRTA